MSDSYKPGKWLAICDVCGFEFFNDELQKRWDGYMVCRADFETRHPQEFIRPVKEGTIPWSRPEPPDTFIEVDYYDTYRYWAEDYTEVSIPDDSTTWYIDPNI